MKVLITSIPGYGHLCPLLPLASALKESGHSVAVATSAGFGTELAAAGVPLLPSGPVWHESEFCCDDPRAAPVDGFRTNLLAFLQSSVIPKMLQDVGAHVESWRPDILLSNDYESCGRVVAEVNRLPFVLASSGPRLPRTFRNQMQGSLHRQARRLMGLDELKALDYSLRWLHLCFTPSDYRFDSGIADQHEASSLEYGIRPTIYDQLFAGARATLARKSYDRPAALCTFGTVFNKNPAVLQAIARGLRNRVGRLIVVLGPGASPFMAEGDFDDIEFISGAPLSSLLPNVDYCVAHGGTSTLMTILAHGKPSLLLPQGADQWINAAVCNQKKLAAVRLHSAAGVAIPVQVKEPLTSEVVTECFDELVGNPIYKYNLQLFQKKLESLPDMDFAVRLLERLAETRLPVVGYEPSNVSLGRAHAPVDTHLDLGVSADN